MSTRERSFGWLFASCITLMTAGDAIAQGAPVPTSAAPEQPSAPIASQANSAVASAPAVADPAAPFGPGHRVSIDSSRPFTYAWVARGVVSTERTYPDPFSKIGRLPTVVQLPAGKYTLLVEGDAISGGSTVFEVGEGPRSVKVEAGSGGLRELSGWMIAIGAAAALAGGVLYASGTKNDAHDRKNSISLPLMIGGGVLVVGGVSLYLVSGTGFRVDPTSRQQGFLPSELRGSLGLGGQW